MYSYRTVTVWSSRFGAWDLTTNTGKSPPIQKGALAVMQCCLITTSRRTANAVSCALETAAFPSTYFMCTLEYLTGRWRFGYSLNQPRPDMYPPWYSQVSGTARLDRGQPPESRGPGPAIPPPSWDSGPGSAPGPRISSRSAQALPPPPRQKGGQGIAGESTVERWWALPPPSPGVTVALSIPTPWRGSRGHRQPQPGSWDWARERRRWEGREKRERERERDYAGARRPLGTPPDGPPPAGWPDPATSGGGTGPTQPSAGVVGWWTAPAPPGRSLPRHRGLHDGGVPASSSRVSAPVSQGSGIRGKEGRGSQGWRATKKVFNNTK